MASPQVIRYNERQAALALAAREVDRAGTADPKADETTEPVAPTVQEVLDQAFREGILDEPAVADPSVSSARIVENADGERVLVEVVDGEPIETPEPVKNEEFAAAVDGGEEAVSGDAPQVFLGDAVVVAGGVPAEETAVINDESTITLDEVDTDVVSEPEAIEVVVTEAVKTRKPRSK